MASLWFVILMMSVYGILAYATYCLVTSHWMLERIEKSYEDDPSNRVALESIFGSIENTLKCIGILLAAVWPVCWLVLGYKAFGDMLTGYRVRYKARQQIRQEINEACEQVLEELRKR